MTSHGLNKRLLAMFEPTSTWYIFTFGQLFTLIDTYSDHTWFPISYKQAILSNVRARGSSRLQLDPILLLVNFWHELAQIMTTYEFIRWISCNVVQIMTTYELVKVWGSDSEHCSKHLQLYLPGMDPTLPIRKGSQLYLPEMAKL